MFAVVQPLFESLAIFAWCVVAAVVPDMRAPESQPTREQVVQAAGEQVFQGLADAVWLGHPETYLTHLSPELRKKHGDSVRALLRRHNLNMAYKLEQVAVSSYEITYKAKILTRTVCPTGYQDNIEYATVTIASAADTAEEAAGRFHSDSGNAAERWEITKWETEKVVPYVADRDR